VSPAKRGERVPREGDVIVVVTCCNGTVGVLSGRRDAWACPRCKGLGSDGEHITLGPGGAMPAPPQPAPQTFAERWGLDGDLVERQPTQEEELGLVHDHIAGAVLRFCAAVDTFHLHELEEFVAAEVPNITPGSPGRILRDLRRNGQVAYRVLSRTDSLYAIEPLEDVA
jgi:hypothetical protein